MSKTNPVPAPAPAQSRFQLLGTYPDPTKSSSAPAPDPAPNPAPNPDPSVHVLEAALNVVTGARRNTYGNPEDNFKTIAAMWTAHLDRRGLLVPGAAIAPHDVAVMMILLKCARLAESPGHFDSLTDAAGYAACAARCVP